MAVTTKEYLVQGMTCGHCEMSIKEEIGEIAGVVEVLASAANGKVSVTGDSVTDDQVAAAIADAGYSLRP